MKLILGIYNITFEILKLFVYTDIFFNIQILLCEAYNRFSSQEIAIFVLLVFENFAKNNELKLVFIIIESKCLRLRWIRVVGTGMV